MSSLGRDPETRYDPTFSGEDTGVFGSSAAEMLEQSFVGPDAAFCLPLAQTISEKLLKLQRTPPLLNDSIIIDMAGRTYELEAVVDPEDLHLPTNHHELVQARMLYGVLKMASVVYDRQSQHPDTIEENLSTDRLERLTEEQAIGMVDESVMLRDDQISEFDAAVMAFGPQIQRVIDWRYRDALGRDNIDDMMQDIWLRAATRWNLFNEGTNRKAWLFQLALNLAKSKIRSNSRKPEIACDPSGRTLLDNPDSGDGIDSVLKDMEGASPPADRPEFLSAASRLAQKLLLIGVQAEFIPTLVAVDGFGVKYRDAAQILGIPLGTVKTRVQRGRTKIKAQLGAGMRNPDRPVGESSAREYFASIY